MVSTYIKNLCNDGPTVILGYSKKNCAKYSIAQTEDSRTDDLRTDDVEMVCGTASHCKN